MGILADDINGLALMQLEPTAINIITKEPTERQAKEKEEFSTSSFFSSLVIKYYRTRKATTRRAIYFMEWLVRG